MVSRGRHTTHGRSSTDELQLELDDDLRAALCDAIGDQLWCDKDPFGLSRTDELNYSWDRFRRQVMHESRFFVFAPPTRTNDPRKDRDELLTPGELLSFVGGAARAAGAIRTRPGSQPILRAREVPDRSAVRTPLDVGPPTADRAKQNRMSAAGIPMFYGSDEIRDRPSGIEVQPRSVRHWRI